VECGQCLVIAPEHLAHPIHCPRCNTIHAAYAFVEASTPIAAAPPIPQPSNPTPAKTSESASEPDAPKARSAPATRSWSEGDPRQAPPQFDPSESAITDWRKRFARAAGAASRLVRLTDRVDAWAYGKRAKLLVAVAAGVVVAPSVTTSTAIQALALAAFGLVLSLLLLARIAMFRNESGEWSATVGAANIGDAAAEAWSNLAVLKLARPNQLAQTAGRLLIGAALVSLAFRATLAGIYDAGIDSWALDWSEEFDWGFFWLGVVVWFWGAYRTNRDGQHGALVVEPTKDRPAALSVARAFDALPAVIDAHDTAAMNAWSRQATHPLASELAKILSVWRPRRAHKEKAYQRSLFRKLREVLPDASPELEVPLRSRGIPSTGRIDILLGRCVLIELKVRLNTSTAQKAVGQADFYCHLWQDKGPVVLVLCDTDRDFAFAFLEPAIRRLRHSGQSIVAILAAT
jgi:hypothetical protein